MRLGKIGWDGEPWGDIIERCRKTLKQESYRYYNVSRLKTRKITHFLQNLILHLLDIENVGLHQDLTKNLLHVSSTRFQHVHDDVMFTILIHTIKTTASFSNRFTLYASRLKFLNGTILTEALIFLPKIIKSCIFKTVIRSSLEYACSVWLYIV